MRSVSGLGRAAVVGAVIAAIVLVAVVLFGAAGGGGYTVKADFQNAGQLVKGNLVEIGGTRAGSVKGLKLTENGQAQVTMQIDDAYAPLAEGTRVLIRQASQSGIANRYVDLQLPQGDKSKLPHIADGATIGTEHTTTAVELDQLFNTLDPPTRKALQDFLKGSAKQYSGVERQANAGFHYLNPALSTSSRFFSELNRDTPLLEHFLVDSSRLVTAVAERRDDLANLVANLNSTTRAIGNQKQSLADAIGRLPGFMRQANTTFVNLRSSLNDVDPLVAASKPVAKKLRPFLAQLQPLAHDARPTVHDLNQVIRKRGAGNDLIELTRTFTPLKQIALDTAQRNGARRRGAFPEITQATKDSAPIVAFGRPYTPELFGWFDDFSTTGGYDALGGISRTQTYFNAFTPDAGGPLQLPGGGTLNLPPLTSIGGALPGALPADLRGEIFKQFTRTGQYRRCPGGGDARAADGSNVLSPSDQQTFNCRESDRSVGSLK